MSEREQELERQVEAARQVAAALWCLDERLSLIDAEKRRLAEQERERIWRENEWLAKAVTAYCYGPQEE